MRVRFRDPRLVPIGLAFFLSGAAALAYQVAWQRILALQTGVGIHSIAVIVAAFMLGLGLGSHVGGLASTRVSETGALRVFAACELGIAAFGSASVWVFYDWLYRGHGWLFADPVRGGAVQFASLLLPTLLMGMSLPFLARAMVRDVETASGTIAFLYGINVLGAATGALVTPWVFVRHHGIRAAVTAAVVANLFAFLAALALAFGRGRPTPARSVAVATPPLARPVAAAAAAEGAGGETPPEVSRPFGTWVALYALSGFCALALEIVWFRIMDVAVKSTAYTFGTLLAVYLLGSAVGSLYGIRLARRTDRPLRAFLTLQCLLLLYAGVSLTALVFLPEDLPGYRWYLDLWGGRRSFNLGGALYWEPIVRLYVVLPLVLFGPPTLLMGISYPILQRAVQDDPATSGRKVGLLQAANIGGCVAGSLLVGLVTLDVLGTSGTVRLLLALGLVFALIGWSKTADRRRFAGAFLALVLAALAVPTQRALWMRLHGTTKPGVLVEEDATGVVALIPGGERIWRLWVSGRSHSSLPFGAIHTTLGAAPALVHPDPVDVAIVGLGSGDTAASAGCRLDAEQRITVFEIMEPEPRLLRELARMPLPPVRLARFLEDPRYRIRLADGRNALDREDALYDVIEADALPPSSPYAGNLYSLEFFQLCGRRLKPGGVVCTWSPTRRVRATFLRAFPHVIEVARGEVLIGSQSPIHVDPETWHHRLFTPRTVRYLGTPRAHHVWSDLQGARVVGREDEPRHLNHDLFPRDEFNTPD